MQSNVKNKYELYQQSGTMRTVDYDPSTVHTSVNMYENADGTPLVEYGQTMYEQLETNEFDIEDEEIFVATIETAKHVIPNDKKEKGFEILHDYKLLNLSPNLAEGEWGTTGWVKKSKVAIGTLRYRMYHIFTKDAVTLGLNGKKMNDFYLEEMTKNITRIKARLLYNTYMKGSSKFYAGEVASYGDLMPENTFDFNELDAIYTALRKTKKIKSQSQLKILLPVGTISQVLRSKQVVDGMAQNFTPFQELRYGGQTDNLRIMGYNFVENAIVPEFAKGEVIPQLTGDNVNANTSTAFAFIYAVPSGDNTLKGITVVTREEETKTVDKEYGDVFSGDLFNEFASRGIQLYYGSQITDATLVNAYAFSTEYAFAGNENIDNMKPVNTVIDSEELFGGVTVEFAANAVVGNSFSGQATVTLANGDLYDFRDQSTALNMIVEFQGGEAEAERNALKSQKQAILANGSMTFNNLEAGDYIATPVFVTSELVTIPGSVFNVKENREVFKAVGTPVSFTIGTPAARDSRATFDAVDGDAIRVTTKAKANEIAFPVTLNVLDEESTLVEDAIFPTLKAITSGEIKLDNGKYTVSVVDAKDVELLNKEVTITK